MVFQYLSDLHFEQTANRAYLKKNPIRPVADTLLIGGDLMPLNSLGQFSEFIDFLSSNWKTVIWVPGNHEFYGSDLAQFIAPRIDKIRDNIILCHRSTIELNGINISGCTLWSEIGKNHETAITSSLQDFNAIKWKGKKLSVENYNLMHKKDIDFLSNSSVTNSSVIISHHVPTLKNYPSKYDGSNLNQAFVSENNLLIEKSNAAYWIYGHHHVNTRSFMLNKTMVLTNQLGYVQLNEHNKFQISSTFTIK